MECWIKILGPAELEADVAAAFPNEPIRFEIEPSIPVDQVTKWDPLGYGVVEGGQGIMRSDFPYQCLPGRRIVAGLLLGAFCGAIVMAAAGLLASDSVQTVAVLAFFGALAGAAVGGIFSGGRLAGQRASFQPQAPGERIVVIAVLLDNEPEALSLVRSMESFGVKRNVEFRLVDELGGWRSPST